MNSVITKITQDMISEAGKEAVSLIINKTTGDDHPEYEKAVIEGTSEAIKNIAMLDKPTALRIYEIIKNKRAERDFFNFSNVLHKFALLIKIKPKETIKDDNDFFWNTLEYTKEVSYEEMQDVIAKILADEYNNPQTYSVHTLQVLKSIDSKTLKSFCKILSLNLSRSGVFQEIFLDTKTIKDLGVDYFDFLNLQNIGLISSNESRVENVGEFVDIYINKFIHFKPKDENQKEIILPNFYCLTNAGKEISKHLEVLLNPEYVNWLRKHYEGRFIIEI